MSSDIILDVRKLEKNYNTTTHEGKENIYSVLKGKTIRSIYKEKRLF